MELRLTTESAALPSSLAPPASVLVLAPCLHPDHDAVCTELLAVDDPEQCRVLVVDVTASPARVGHRWAQHVEDPPAALSTVGVQYMEPADDRTAPAPASLPEPETEYVQEPGDLSGLGVAASATLRTWSDADEQVVVCVRSLTTILQYADDGPALAFLNELFGHCSAVGALAHVHLDPTAVDERTVEGIRGQVDAVVELAEY